MKKQTLQILSFLILFASCNIATTPSDTSKLTTTNLIDSSKVTFYSPSELDTTIILSDILHSKYNGQNLTEKLAKSVLYQHFKKEGYFNSDNLPGLGSLTESDSNKLIIDYCSIFLADLNNNKYSDAVITYWVTPLYASGHCWQPHAAVIVDTDNGYKITNEEFIPSQYAIDSVKTLYNKVVIFGNDYECSNDKVLRHFRLRLTF